jgi:hypothetical protein
MQPDFLFLKAHPSTLARSIRLVSRMAPVQGAAAHIEHGGYP